MKNKITAMTFADRITIEFRRYNPGAGGEPKHEDKAEGQKEKEPKKPAEFKGNATMTSRRGLFSIS